MILLIYCFAFPIKVTSQHFIYSPKPISTCNSCLASVDLYPGSIIESILFLRFGNAGRAEDGDDCGECKEDH